MCAWGILRGALNRLRYGKEKRNQGGEAKAFEG